MMNIQEIEKIVCSWKFINPINLHTSERIGNHCFVRHLIWFLCYEKIGDSKRVDLTQKKLGLYFGRREHTTVENGIGVIKNYIDTDKKKAEEINFLRKMVDAGIAKEDVFIFDEQLKKFDERLKKIEKYLNIS